MIGFENQLVVLLLLFTYTHGSCFFDALQSSSSDDSTNYKYCEYLNTKHSVSSNWTLPYPECLFCQCSSSGLQCCGYGIEAGVIEPPEHCQLKSDTCDVILVETDDPSTLCEEHRTTKTSRASKKKKKKKSQSKHKSHVVPHYH